MAFERLKNLGEPRWSKIKNELIRGVPCMNLARQIQMEWHEFNDVAERTLTQQLSRLRIEMQKGIFGEEAARDLEEAKTPHQKVEILSSFGSIDALQEMEKLVRIQMKRVVRLSVKEENMPLPIPNLNEIIRDEAELLKDLQKMRFDLGLDEFHGVLPGIRGVTASATLPDGTQVQKSVYEAVDIMNSIFDKRGIGSSYGNNGNG